MESCASGAGSERKAACGWACAVVVLSLATTLLLVAISYLHRDLDTAMSGKDEGARAAHCRAPPAAARPATLLTGPGRAEGFYRAIMKFVLVILVAAPLFALAGAPSIMPASHALYCRVSVACDYGSPGWAAAGVLS
jgi:hypothetical protein